MSAAASELFHSTGSPGFTQDIEKKTSTFSKFGSGIAKQDQQNHFDHPVQSWSLEALEIDQVNHTRVVGGQPFVRLFARSVPAGTFTERTACLPASRFAAVQKGLMSDTERVVGRRGEGVREGGGRYMEVMRGEGGGPTTRCARRGGSGGDAGQTVLRARRR